VVALIKDTARHPASAPADYPREFAARFSKATLLPQFIELLDRMT